MRVVRGRLVALLLDEGGEGGDQRGERVGQADADADDAGAAGRLTLTTRRTWVTPPCAVEECHGEAWVGAATALGNGGPAAPDRNAG
ncbi:hypothetical protein RM550_02140 [Streptomyces sp. DSM 41527]|uniref:Uncharacterized protein n=1 Tax=Streptomyces mooreae TaxID=3075523 RepID=A0ABU2T0A6_9ACTN|nr:hypothetical protein [Streptomyces sp. DSM 41527]MDT0454537.1 hypothetical protein [Streptomyces sp. DSM 41527]